MSAEYKQQLSDKRFDSVRVKLLHLIKSHDALGYAMNEVRTQHAAERSRDAEADLVEADQHLVSFLRLIAAANKDMKQVEQQSSVSYLLAMQVLETAQRTNDIAEEFKAQCTYLRAQSRKQQQRKRAHPDDMPCLVILAVVVAVWYLFSR